MRHPRSNTDFPLDYLYQEFSRLEQTLVCYCKALSDEIDKTNYVDHTGTKTQTTKMLMDLEN